MPLFRTKKLNRKMEAFSIWQNQQFRIMVDLIWLKR